MKNAGAKFLDEKVTIMFNYTGQGKKKNFNRFKNIMGCITSKFLWHLLNMRSVLPYIWKLVSVYQIRPFSVINIANGKVETERGPNYYLRAGSLFVKMTFSSHFRGTEV
jgi:hypothetical protein